MRAPPLKVVQHLVAPGYEQARGLVLDGETIEQFLTRMEWDFKIPTICVMNGEPVLRSEWAVMPADLGSITFLSRPHGGGNQGGGSKALQIVGLVAMIALAAAAPWAAGALAPLVGISSAAGISALSAGIALGGGLLISTLINWAAGGQNEDTSVADQVYSLTAGGNTAKPLGVIPVNYGTLKTLPNYGSTPWSEYISNDQYLNVQLTLGVGKHFVDKMTIDDTPFWNHTTGLNPAFANADIQFCPPGTPITLFPTNIVSATEVSGQELPGPTSPGFWVGGFIVNESGTQITKIVIDLAFPGGLYYIHVNEGLIQFSVPLNFQYRLVDDAGTPIGSWIEFIATYITDKTKTPKRLSIGFDVPAGRYEVRGNRGNLPNNLTISGVNQGSWVPNPASDTDSPGTTAYTISQDTSGGTIQDNVVWLGLRGYVVGESNFDHEYQIAIRMKADAQLSGQSSRQFGVVATRILPVWNGTEMVEQPTQNALWAFWDAATNELYGAKRPLSKVDFQTVVDMAAAADARGDTFNYQFTDFVTIPDAFDTILASVRSKHCWVGDVLTVVRDEWREVPSMLITDHQIVRGSLEIISIFNDETGVDSIIGEFLNENTWRPAELQFPPNTMSFSSTQPSRIRIPGVTKPEHILREIGFVWNQSQLRRTKVTLSTGHEGRMLKLLSAVKVQSHLPQSWGQAGEVVSLGVDGLTITTNRDLVLSEEFLNYVEFRDKRGRYFGPIICTVVVLNTTQFKLDATDLALVETQLGMTLEDALERMDGAEPPVFVLGIEGNLSRNCMMLTAKPNGDTVDLTLVVDSEDVHNPDVGDVGDFPEPPFVLNPKIPVPTLLVASFRLGIAEPTLDVSWWPALGAVGYVAQVSYNDGISWEGLYEGSNPGFSKTVNPAALRVRVLAFNAIIGPWVQVSVAPPTIVIAPGVVAPESMQKALHEYVMELVGEAEGVANNIRQIISGALADLDAGNYLDQKEMKRNLVSQVGDATAAFEEAITVATGPGSALVTQITTLTAIVAGNTSNITTNANAIATTNGAVAALTTSVGVSIDGLTASVTTNATAIGTINGKMAASWALTLDVNHYVTGMQFLNDGSTSAFVINTDNFLIAKPGILAPITMLSLQVVSGVSTMALRGNFLADGSVTARTISVVNLSAVSGSMGTLTAGKILSPSGNFLIDCDNQRIVISV